MDESQNLLLKEILENQRGMTIKLDDLTSKVAYKADIQEIKESMKTFALQRDLQAHKDDVATRFIKIDSTLEDWKKTRWPDIAKSIGGTIAASVILAILYFVGGNAFHQNIQPPTQIQTTIGQHK